MPTFKVDHAALAVKDLTRSRAFYEFLGGRVVSKPSPHFLEMMLGDLRLHVILAGDKTVRAGVGIDHLCLNVETLADLEAVCVKLNSYPERPAGSPFRITESPPLGPDGKDHAEERPPRRALYAQDPDGIILEFRCYA